jgi:hypothetical protein
MNVEYNPAATRGQQWLVNGVALSRLDAAAVLRASGLSINQADEKLAAAKLRAAQLTGTA